MVAGHFKHNIFCATKSMPRFFSYMFILFAFPDIFKTLTKLINKLCTPTVWLTVISSRLKKSTYDNLVTGEKWT
jgi:hypothetical protein